MKVLILSLMLLIGVFVKPVLAFDRAEVLKGHFFKNSPSSMTLLMESNLKKYNLLISDQTILEDIESLQDGDYISGFGKIDEPGERVLLQEIEYIGLKRLIGKWVDYHNRILIHFSNFTTAHIVDFQVPVPQRVEYTLVPHDTNKWTIFIADEMSVSFGALSHQPGPGPKGLVRIDVINSQTGELEKTIRLSPAQP